jgi:hypothetical protein
MRGHYKHGFCAGFYAPPFGFRFHGPWGARHWGHGFPKRQDYLQMLETYKEELEEAQREIAEELKEVAQEIEKLKS